MPKPTYVLGTGLSHDGSACLLKDGEICVAIEKERITRRKHDGHHDSAAITYCLDTEGIRLEDLTLIVQNANFNMFQSGSTWFRGPRLIDDQLPVVTISHHLAHAYSALGTSPFEEAAILIVDGCGNAYDECIDRAGAELLETPPPGLEHLFFEKDSLYLYQNGRMTTVVKDFSPFGFSVREYPLMPSTTMHSIGGMYNAASTYVFNGFEDPGKLMGLAPFGRPGQHGFEIFSLKDGRVFVNYDWMASMKNPCRTPALFDDSFQEYADFAFHVQKEVERALLYLFEKRLARVPCRNVAYAGGVALNAVANWRLQQIADTERFYVQPAAGDNGLAIGCAYYGWLEVLKRPRRMHTGSTCFGRHYPDASIDKALNTRNSEIEIHRANDVTEAAAAHLNQGRTVAWFQGGSEFGPRALGNRSILADPRLPRMHSRINRQIKFREDFRPFAPSVPLDDVSTYFDCETESPYMLLVAPVRKEWADKIPAVVHRDGSARIQTVTEESNPRYYKLLKEFKSAAGLSILLNTSFNKKGMPIVETPEEALSFYLECALDVLVIGNYIVTKAQILPAKPGGAIPELIHARLKRKPAESRALGGMYQINVVGVESWTMDLNLPDPAVTPGAARCPDVVVEARAHDLAAILTGKPADSLELVRSGKLQLKGNAARAQTLMRLLFS